MKKKLFLLLLSCPLILTSCNRINEPSDSIITEDFTEFVESESLTEESSISEESESEVISETEIESEIITEEESETLESESEEESETEIVSESVESESEQESESNKYLIDNPYYSNIDISSKNAFNSSMQKLMFDTHKKYSTYGEIRYQFGRSDKDPNKQGNILCFYSRISMSSSWDNGKTYNREHVWPKASSGGLFSSSVMGSNNNYKGAGSDLHHVRPAKTDINEDRGSQRFGSYQPNDNVKGDVARIIMYMYIHYSDEIKCNATNRDDYVGHLKLSNVFTSINLIATWNKLDPVDDLERARNDYCYAYQGNRNPFIDNSEWVNLALGLD